MKIKNLEVKNFKSCPDGTYALSQINVLLGKNGRGKIQPSGGCQKYQGWK